MKSKRIFSISVATACLLMNAPMSVFAVGNTGVNETGLADASSATNIRTPSPQAVTFSALKATAVKPTTAEPYTLTAEDVAIYRCREDDRDSNTPYIDAVSISWKGGVDISQPQYRNIVIPDTLPFDKPVLDDEGREQHDAEGNVITEKVEMPVIKAYLNYDYSTNQGNLEKVTVSKNVRVLGGFKDCINLSEVVIPENSALETFENDMFSKTAIQSVYIPAGVTELPDRMFFACKNLTSVTFAEDSKLTKIGNSAFQGTALNEIDIPDSVTELGEYIFNECPLEKITFPDALEEIPPYAFAYCTALKNVTFGSKLTSIGNDAFENTALEEVVIPDTVTYIGNAAFNNITALKSVTVGSGVKDIGRCFVGCKNLSSLNLSEGLETIWELAFEHTQITELTIPSTVRKIYGGAFSQCEQLEKLTFAEGSHLESISNLNGDGVYKGGAFYGCKSLKTLKLPVSTTPFTIADSTFESCSNLREVNLGNCKELGSILHDDYYHNGRGAFLGCGSLRSVTFGDSLEIIGCRAFHLCSNLLGTIEFPNSLRIIGDNAFNSCSSLEDVIFNEGLEYIGYDQMWGGGSFAGCDLHEINLPDSVKEVGNNCFAGNVHVESVKLSDSMTVIPDGFLDNYGQEVASYSVSHGSSTNVGVHGLMKTLIIPDNIKEIGYDAFDGCLDLEYLDLGQVEYIGTGAFSCSSMLLNNLQLEHASLKTVVMSPALKEIGTRPPHSEFVDDPYEGQGNAKSAYTGVFDGQGDFEGLILPKTLEKVGGYALHGCTAVKEFTATENLKFVGTHAFDSCTNLTEITFPDSANAKFEDYIFANTGITEIKIPGWVDTIPVGFCNNCLNLNNLTLCEGIIEAGGSAFGNTAVKSVIFPESCLYIDDSVFQNAPVTSVKFGSKTLSVGSNAFVKDTHFELMESVVIPESVKSIGEKAFGYYKDSDKTYAELCKEAEKTNVTVQSLIKPTIANNDFILYGGISAKRYAQENGMTYGGTITADDDIIYGDANTDGSVGIADAVLILQTIANPDTYKLTEKGRKNADTCNVGDGVTPKDALAIQMLEAKSVSSLPIEL